LLTVSDLLFAEFTSPRSEVREIAKYVTEGLSFSGRKDISCKNEIDGVMGRLKNEGQWI
jgi:hypothetical protein